MEFSTLNETFPEIYPIAIPETGLARRVRGPGRYLWSARKCVETLALGGKVWVKTGRRLSDQQFGMLIDRALSSVPSKGIKSSDFFSAEQVNLRNERSFWGKYSFSETVGLWLEKGGDTAASLLSPFISTEGFDFSPTEYLDLLERLKTALRRYEKQPIVGNGLEDLNTGFFRHQSLEESTVFIQKHLNEYLQRGAELHRRYLVVIHHHARSSVITKRKELRARSSRLEALGHEASAASKLTGRAQRKATSELNTAWRKYLKTYQSGEETGAKDLGVEALQQLLGKELDGVASGFRLLKRSLKTDAMSLNALTVNSLHGNAETLRELEGLLNELLREVDEAGLYQLPLRQTDAATTPRQLQQLDSLLGKLRNTERHLGELPLFYDQRHFWYAQPAHLRRLLAALLDLPPQEWEAAFSSWYFERCLEREQRPERFYRTESPASTEEERKTQRAPSTSEALVFLPADAPWPTTAGANDLFMDLSGTANFSAQDEPEGYSVVPLSDTSALHLAVSGYRNPVLAFSQPFQLLHAPQWGVCKAETPPVGAKNSVLLQLDENNQWFPLSEWKGEAAKKMNVFLPEQLSATEEEALLECWELLIMQASKITFFHALAPNAITQGLLSDGFNGAFLISALLRAAEAAQMEPFDHKALIAMGQEVRHRCAVPNPTPHTLAVRFGSLLAEKLDGFFIESHVPWRDTFLPLLLQSPSGKKTVILPDGRLPGLADDTAESARHRELKISGFQVVGLDALKVWEDLTAETARICELLAEK